MVRIAVMEDFDRINELRKQVNALHVQGRPDHFRAGWKEELQNHAKEMIEAGNKDILVAERNGVICGYACVDYINLPESPYRYARQFYHVSEFGVDKTFHRQGVATELVEFMKTQAKEKGFSGIELDVWEFNPEARAFYEAGGFECIRRYMEMKL
ncbi:MAG: GNAT family N-acetyltransferase [Lachnospiraceae bacterium]|nr:GNAT family N-acetyltransferase [Lachnospiraceae bacterium]